MGLYMDYKSKIFNSLKNTYQSVRVANIHPNGVLAVRAFILLMFVVIILIIVQFVMSFIKGDVSPEDSRIIDIGIKIIDHTYAVPGVLATVIGLLMLWLDRNHNGIPDKLEEDNSKNENIYKPGPRSDI